MLNYLVRLAILMFDVCGFVLELVCWFVTLFCVMFWGFFDLFILASCCLLAFDVFGFGYLFGGFVVGVFVTSV